MGPRSAAGRGPGRSMAGLHQTDAGRQLPHVADMGRTASSTRGRLQRRKVTDAGGLSGSKTATRFLVVKTPWRRMGAIVRDYQGMEYPVGPGKAIYAPAGIAGSHQWQVGGDGLQLLSVRGALEGHKRMQVTVDRETHRSYIELDELVKMGGVSFSSHYLLRLDPGPCPKRAPHLRFHLDIRRPGGTGGHIVTSSGNKLPFPRPGPVKSAGTILIPASPGAAVAARCVVELSAERIQCLFAYHRA